MASRVRVIPVHSRTIVVEACEIYQTVRRIRDAQSRAALHSIARNLETLPIGDAEGNKNREMYRLMQRLREPRSKSSLLAIAKRLVFAQRATEAER